MLRMPFPTVLWLLIVAASAALAVTAPAAGQGEPASILAYANATSPFNARQREEIRAWAAYFTDQLATGDPELVAQAHRRLVDPLRATTVRPLFREEYSSALVSEMERLFEKEVDIYVAVNALQAAAMLGTDGAARLMLQRADPLTESRKQVRLWAAHGIGSILRDGTIDPGRVVPILREVVRMASRESDWMVLQRHFQAIGYAPAEVATDRQLALLNDVLDRIETSESTPHELMQATFRMLVLLRDRYINLSVADQRSFGTNIAPAIGRVFEIVLNQWDGTIEDDDHASAYEGAVAMAEQLLRIIDAQLRGSQLQTQVEQALNDRDRDAFEREANRWLAVLSQPPYGR